MDNLKNPTTNSESGHNGQENQLWQYVQTMEPDSIARLSQPASDEVHQVMERHVISLLGNLPSEDFDVAITTSREHMGQLLAAAMMNGYFLRAAEQRLAFETMLQGAGPSAPPESA